MINKLKGFAHKIFADKSVNEGCALKSGGDAGLIYCSVEFKKGGKTYYYRTEDESYKAGDAVIVPVGKEMAEKRAVITKIEIFAKSDVPYPVENTKYILRRAQDERIVNINTSFTADYLIKQAVKDFTKNRSEQTAVNVLTVISYCMKHGGEFVIPVAVPPVIYDENAFLGINNGAVVTANPDYRFEMRRLSTNTGKNLFAAFTDKGEALKGEPVETLYYSIDEFLEIAANTEDVEGVVLNPWDQAFFMSCDAIKAVLNSGK